MKLWIFVVAFSVFLASTLALKNEICGQPHSRNGNDIMSCDAYMPSWSYDPSSNKCIEFIYGGCGGNANRFPTKGICEDKCLE